ncbi:hypothetical protein [Desulfitobacterium sp.]|uniref:hypothetical protein n=1 Tax=Desulfitobacterium sp. TaxID=49981 RepID=UPI002B20F3AE|nr:hypothetical protein [Desulfitobacterium sp.]MEA4901604.1 hypothetical protein [Desulfitobacterium sp.]
MHTIEIGPYKGLGLTAVRYDNNDIEKSALKAVLYAAMQWQQQHQPIKTGDKLTVRIDARCGDRLIPELCVSRLVYEVSSNRMLAAFNNAIGHVLNDSFDMHINFDEQCPVAAVKNKTVDFIVTIDNVQFTTAPVLNNTLAREIDPSVKNLAELKNKFRKTVEARYQRQADEAHINQIMTLIENNSKIVFDQTKLDQSVDESISIAKGMAKRMLNSRGDTADFWREDSLFFEECRNVTLTELKINLIFNEIARLENISVSSEEAAVSMQRYMTDKQSTEEFRKNFPTDDSYREFYCRKRSSTRCWNGIYNSAKQNPNK